MEEVEKELTELKQAVQENTRILNQLRRNMVYSRLFRLAYWLVILAFGIGLFYYLEPIFDNLTSIYSGGNANLQSEGIQIPFNSGSQGALQELLELYSS